MVDMRTRSVDLSWTRWEYLMVIPLQSVWEKEGEEDKGRAGIFLIKGAGADGASSNPSCRPFCSRYGSSMTWFDWTNWSRPGRR
jgi:hypothetical protein